MPIRTALTLTALACSVGVSPGVDKPEAAPGNPPALLLATGIDRDGRLVLVSYRTIFIHPADPGVPAIPRENERSESAVSLKGVKISGIDGKEVTVEAARKRLAGKETPVLVRSWGEKLPDGFKPLFKDDVLVFVFPDQAPGWKDIESPGTPVRR